MRRLILIGLSAVLFSPVCYPQAEIIFSSGDTWGPGRFNKVEVTLTFEKSGGFARFSQEFPVGFSVEPDRIGPGDFNWNGSQLNIVWMKIPQSGQIIFSYYVMPEKNMEGNVELNARLVIVPDRMSKQTVKMKTRSVIIAGQDGILPEELKLPDRTGNVTNAIKPAVAAPSERHGVVIYRIQVSSSAGEVSEEQVRRDLGISRELGLITVRSGDRFKYLAGEFSDYRTAQQALGRLKAGGVPDAFIVAYKDGKQVPVSEVREGR